MVNVLLKTLYKERRYVWMVLANLFMLHTIMLFHFYSTLILLFPVVDLLEELYLLTRF
jgi:hypothetical protein